MKLIEQSLDYIRQRGIVTTFCLINAAMMVVWLVVSQFGEEELMYRIALFENLFLGGLCAVVFNYYDSPVAKTQALSWLVFLLTYGAVIVVVLAFSGTYLSFWYGLIWGLIMKFNFVLWQFTSTFLMMSALFTLLQWARQLTQKRELG